MIIEDNDLSYNESGIDVTLTWAPWSINTDMKVNGQLLTSSEDAYTIGEALKAANTQDYIGVSLDQNDEVEVTNSTGKEYYTVLGGYRSPILTISDTNENTVTVQMPATDIDILNAADKIEFEKQVDNDNVWSKVYFSWVEEPIKASMTLDNGHAYRIRVKMTHTSYEEPGTLTRTLITYSNPVMLNTDRVPATPTNVTAAAGNGQAAVSFTPPTDDGGSPITGYIVTSNPGNITAAGTGTNITVTDLTNGTKYTFTVTAINVVGNSLESAPSNEVTSFRQSSGKNTTPSPAEPKETGVDVLVNGKVENAGTATTTKDGEKTIITIVVDEKKLEEKLAAEGNNAVVTIPVNTKADIVVGELNGQMVKNMESKLAVVEVKTEEAAYTLPAQQINIDAISAEIGVNVELKDIKVQIEISKSSNETVKVVESSAKNGEFTIVAPPIDFVVKSTYEGRTIEVSRFNAYVERTVAIPEGIDPSKITTGIVVEPDGTVRHVPTKIIVIEGRYYAKINSLTNSTYTVVWHPLEFQDVANHWAKEAINDMGSRMVISGVGEGMFEPDRDITRAEFAAIMVRGLGLKPGTGNMPFTDVSSFAWYGEFIETAYEYGIITGYENGVFKPMEKITREQAMTMIQRAMSITGLKINLTEDEIEKLLASFGDAAKSSDYAKNSISACVKADIVTGRNGNTLAPKENITRAEVAVIVGRLLKKSNLI